MLSGSAGTGAEDLKRHCTDISQDVHDEDGEVGRDDARLEDLEAADEAFDEVRLDASDGALVEGV